MNGDDILEYEQENFQAIFEEFTEHFEEEYNEFKDVYKEITFIEEDFIDYVGRNKWGEFVLTHYTEYLVNEAEFIAEMIKDDKMGV